MAKAIDLLNLGILAFKLFFISNADIDNEDMSDITDWTDADEGDGASTQATFDGKSCMKLHAITPTASAAIRTQDIGSFGARTVFSMSIYADAIGTRANGDHLSLQFYDGATGLSVAIASDGLFVFDGATWNEVGTDLVVQDVWQEWTFDVNWTAQTLSVYLDKVLKVSGIDCSYASIIAEGTITFRQNGAATANRITYIDWFKAGSNFA